jgi:hypothetical protein
LRRNVRTMVAGKGCTVCEPRVCHLRIYENARNVVLSLSNFAASCPVKRFCFCRQSKDLKSFYLFLSRGEIVGGRRRTVQERVLVRRDVLTEAQEEGAKVRATYSMDTGVGLLGVERLTTLPLRGNLGSDDGTVEIPRCFSVLNIRMRSPRRRSARRRVFRRRGVTDNAP